jgi:ribosome-binding factor A
MGCCEKGGVADLSANRIARVSEEIKRALSDIIRNDVRDPRLPDMLSIMRVDVTNDFAHAKVFYSVLSGRDDEKDIRRALKSASGFIRRELGARVRLRQTPELHFELDRSIEQVIALNKLIDDTIKDDTIKNDATKIETINGDVINGDTVKAKLINGDTLKCEEAKNAKEAQLV